MVNTKNMDSSQKTLAISIGKNLIPIVITRELEIQRNRSSSRSIRYNSICFPIQARSYEENGCRSNSPMFRRSSQYKNSDSLGRKNTFDLGQPTIKESTSFHGDDRVFRRNETENSDSLGRKNTFDLGQPTIKESTSFHGDDRAFRRNETVRKPIHV